jgi:hypothetical protein
MKEQIDRLGFEAWADNLIVNALEDMAGGFPAEVEFAQGDATLFIYTDGQHTTAVVRAWVKDKGWQTHSRTIHPKGGQP